MKSRIFMYLFIFALLFILFQYVNSKKYFEAETLKINNISAERDSLKNYVDNLEDSTQQLIFKNLDLQYFSLENNDDALAYYEHLKVDDLPRYIADKLLETNEKKGDNPLVPYAGMNGSMKINKIKILNHKWLLADFSDGRYWGELFIKYELKDDLGIDFTRIDHLLYTRSSF
ncbi:hydrolase [Abyssalbus ytuae]|uniref:Hydrolase n=1 Tax=Abyssalbus ytuae TaxID=2926907 RepID=A0A9E7CZ97_9FLAO|nr:hydrolase [Abyssalbus ytuae]UOB17365.1 hydrolase [Abyssalbus ytuae]